MKVWDKEEKRREEKWRRMKIVVCTNLKQTSAKFGDFMGCVGQNLGKISCI